MSKNDSKLLTKVSSLIPGQVPDFVESDHSLFVKFLKDYYQYLEAGRLTLTATVNYITLETTTVSYVLSEDGDDNRVVTGKLSLELPLGLTQQFRSIVRTQYKIFNNY